MAEAAQHMRFSVQLEGARVASGDEPMIPLPTRRRTATASVEVQTGVAPDVAMCVAIADFVGIGKPPLLQRVWSNPGGAIVDFILV